MNELSIQLNSEKGRFETTVEAHLCVLDFTLDGDVVSMNHVGVPDAVDGRGIAGALTRYALDHAREQGWRVKPNCPYVKSWIERHPDYKTLID